MTTFYFKAETGGGSPAGDGSITDPWNGAANVTWGGGGVSAGDTLQLTNSSVGEVLTIGASGSSGNPITVDFGGFTWDGTGSASNIAVRTTAAHTDITLQNGTVKGDDSTHLMSIHDGDSTSSAIRRIIIQDMTIGPQRTATAVAALQLWGHDFTVQRCTISQVGQDGIFFAGGADLTVRDCTISGVSLDTVGGDCIQVDNRSGAQVPDNLEISCNTLDHTDVDVKQGLIVADGGTGLVIEGNVVTMDSAHTTVVGLRVDSSGAVRNNTVSGGSIGIVVAGTGTDSDIYNNAVSDGNTSGIGSGSAVTGARIYHNAVSNCTIGIDTNVDDAAILVRFNNIATSTTGIFKQGANVVETHNIIQASGDEVQEGGLPAALGTGSSAANPKLASNLYTLPSSPGYENVTPIAWHTGKRDQNGIGFRATPDTGLQANTIATPRFTILAVAPPVVPIDGGAGEGGNTGGRQVPLGRRREYAKTDSRSKTRVSYGVQLEDDTEDATLANEELLSEDAKAIVASALESAAKLAALDERLDGLEAKNQDRVNALLLLMLID